MRRKGVCSAEGFQVLGGGQTGKGVVRPLVVELVGEGVDVGLEAVEAMRKFVAAVELVAPG
jgi:hypothetical protein